MNRQSPYYEELIPNKKVAYEMFETWLFGSSNEFNSKYIPKIEKITKKYGKRSNSFHIMAQIGSAFSFFVKADKSEIRRLKKFLETPVEEKINKWVLWLIYIGFEPELIVRKNPMTKKAKEFISEKIRILMREGYPQKQAIAIAYSMAVKAGYKIPKVKKGNPMEGSASSLRNRIIEAIDKIHGSYKNAKIEYFKITPSELIVEGTYGGEKNRAKVPLSYIQDLDVMEIYHVLANRLLRHSSHKKKNPQNFVQSRVEKRVQKILQELEESYPELIEYSSYELGPHEDLLEGEDGIIVSVISYDEEENAAFVSTAVFPIEYFLSQTDEKIKKIILTNLHKDISEAKGESSSYGEEWIIKDWTGSIKFNGMKFKSFEDADEFLTEWIYKNYPHTVDDEKAFSEERGEYYAELIED